MTDPAWIMVGIAFLGLIGTANAWMLKQIKDVRDETKTDRHGFRGYMQQEFMKFDNEQHKQDEAAGLMRERIAKLEMKVLGNGNGH